MKIQITTKLTYLVPATFGAMALMAALFGISELAGSSRFLRWGATALGCAIPVGFALWYVLYDFESIFTHSRRSE